MISNVTVLAFISFLLHDHVFQELVLLPCVHHSEVYYTVENKIVSLNFCYVTKEGH